MVRERYYQKLYKSEDNYNSKKSREKTSKIRRVSQEQYTCPICNKVGGKNTMKRWGHGTNCTKKPLSLNQWFRHCFSLFYKWSVKPIDADRLGGMWHFA